MNNDNYNIPSVSPEVAFIDDLVGNVENGKIVLPEFQRPYVWKKEDVIALFDSIYKGYPIGSVLLWDGGGKDIPYLHYIGGKKIDGFSSERFYIVDGQQRLTTLFCCLSDEIVDDDGKWELYFNLKDETFSHTINKLLGSGCYLSMRSIKKTTTFLKEARRIFEQTGDEKLVEKAEYLADRIRKYKMAIIKLGAGNLEEVVQVFSRLNSRGKNIKEQDLVYALTYDKYDGSKINFFIDEVRECFSRYIHVEQRHSEIYLQLIKTAIGFEIYDKDRNKIVERLKYIDENEPHQWGKIISALEETLSFVVNTLGINNVSKLPYAHQLFMIFHFYYNNKNTYSTKLLTEWFFLISIFGIGSESPSKREKVIDFFRNGMHKDFLDSQLSRILRSNAQPIIPEKYTSNSAVAKTISLAINFYLTKELAKFRKEVNLSEFSIYPPKNIFQNGFTDSIGCKVFYQKNNLVPHADDIFKYIEDLLPTESLVKRNDLSKVEVIAIREKYIGDIYFTVSDGIIAELRNKYL